MLTDRAMCRAGAWLAILLAAASSSPARSAFDVEAPSDPAGATRAVGGRPVKKLENPKWLMPLIVTKAGMKGYSQDGRLAGFGVRIPGKLKFFLAHIRSITHIVSSMANETVARDNGPFMWWGPTLQLDVLEQNSGKLYKPAHRVTLSDEIAIYKMEVRRPTDPKVDPPAMNAKIVLGASMEYLKNQTDCRLIVYSASPGRYDSTKASVSNRQLVSLPVAIVPSGRLDQVSIRLDEPESSGAVCGVLSDLGAPIVCGQGSEMRVTHMLARKRGEACSSDFQALSLEPFIKLIHDTKD